MLNYNYCCADNLQNIHDQRVHNIFIELVFALNVVNSQ